MCSKSHELGVQPALKIPEPGVGRRSEVLFAEERLWAGQNNTCLSGTPWKEKIRDATKLANTPWSSGPPPGFLIVV